jgi:hypothetical protein
MASSAKYHEEYNNDIPNISFTNKPISKAFKDIIYGEKEDKWISRVDVNTGPKEYTVYISYTIEFYQQSQLCDRSL